MQNNDNKVLVLGGAGRGLSATAPVLARLQKEERIPPVVLVCDPVAEKLRSIEVLATDVGFTCETVQTAVEVLAPSKFVGVSVLQVDRAQVIADTCRGGPPGAIIAALIVAPPSGPLLGIYVTLGRDDVFARAQAVVLFDALAKVSAQAGSDEVLGADASPIHRAQLPAVRQQFRKLLEDSLPRALDDRLSSVPALQIIRGGAAPEPLRVLAPVATWRTANELASATEEARTAPYRRGTNICVVEPTHDLGVRFHRISVRRTDGQFAVLHQPLSTVSALVQPDLLESESITLQSEWNKNSAIATSD